MKIPKLGKNLQFWKRLSQLKNHNLLFLKTLKFWPKPCTVLEWSEQCCFFLFPSPILPPKQPLRALHPHLWPHLCCPCGPCPLHLGVLWGVSVWWGLCLRRGLLCVTWALWLPPQGTLPQGQVTGQVTPKADNWWGWFSGNQVEGWAAPSRKFQRVWGRKKDN